MTIGTSGQAGAQGVSVIYSFKSRWLEDIQSGRIGVFFRKRGPARKPKKVFIYAGSPISSIVAVADVERMEDVNLDRSLELADLGKISDEELKSYVGPDGCVKVIFLTNHRKLKKPLSISELRRIFNFHPPQNFMRIDREISEKIEECGR